VTLALVLVDLMPRILSLPLAPHSGEDVLAGGRRLATAFRRERLPVVLVHTVRPDVARQPPGSGIVDGLASPTDIVVVKRTIGAFYDTVLHSRLRQTDANTLVLAGLVTTLGVESTARAAADHGYELEFAADAMSDFDADLHQFAVTRTFPHLGKVTTTRDYLSTPR
jgi:nicotinamidase-related amidase